MASSASGPAVLIGAELGHYRIVEKIGAGGMGEVYRARDEHLERDVAVKILLPGTLADDAARKHFRHEALILSRLNHPNIATIYDFDTQGVDFLVMEYISGQTLRRKISKGPLAEKEVLNLGVQVAEGLHAAHEHGITHSDLKPENLRFTDEGRLKILDFGLARLRRTGTGNSETESIASIDGGTLPYMSPEQLEGESVDARSDIYAAGCVLYEIATGVHPYAGLDLARLVSAIAQDAPMAPALRNPRVSSELQRIILKCLERDADNRYQSAKELAVDLQSLRRVGHVSHVQPRKARVSRNWRRTAIAAGATVIVSLLVVVAARLGLLDGKRSAGPVMASIAVLPFTDLSPQHDQEYFSDGLAEEVLAQLNKVPNLRVAARTSAFRFKGTSEDLREIARELNVSNILDGSVRREGDRVRVSAQLVKADDGFSLWSESYDREFKDIFAVQESIAGEVSAALRLKLQPKEASLAAAADPRAYEAFLHARYLSHMLDKQSTPRALAYVDAAIRLDPNHAPSYALRGDVTFRAGELDWMPLAAAVERARADALKAIALNPNLPDGYRLLSTIQSEGELNCPGAEVSLKQASQLARGDPDIFRMSGMLAMCQGRVTEAIDWLKQELLLDPLRPDEYMFLGQMLRDVGMYDDAEKAIDKSLSLDPNVVIAHEIRGEIDLARGNPERALEEMEREREGGYKDLGLALAYHALGRRQESDTALNRLTQRGGAWAFQIAQAYAYRGEASKAFEWMERAYALRDPGLEWVKSDFKLASLRTDPRYAELLTKMNLSR